MGQKCEGNCGLWVLNEIILKKYPENLKKNRGSRFTLARTDLLCMKNAGTQWTIEIGKLK
jgi:hypothetical protein